MKLQQIQQSLFEDIETPYNAVTNRIDERSGIDTTDEIGQLLQTAGMRYDAAKKGLAIANKLKNPEDRRKHQSRVMSNLNALRQLVKRLDSILS